MLHQSDRSCAAITCSHTIDTCTYQDGVWQSVCQSHVKFCPRHRYMAWLIHHSLKQVKSQESHSAWIVSISEWTFSQFHSRNLIQGLFITESIQQCRNAYYVNNTRNLIPISVVYCTIVCSEGHCRMEIILLEAIPCIQRILIYMHHVHLCTWLINHRSV